MNKAAIPIGIISGSIFIAILIIFNKPTDSNDSGVFSSSPSQGTSIIIDGDRQIIELTAKGGYSPSSVQAGANKDTTLRVKTSNTFDCSVALSIPSLGISKMLPPNGSTDIAIGSQKTGTLINGTCAMGMYNFSILFN